MLKKLELYWNRDKTKYAILVSTRGVGWSVMNVPELAYDKRVVEFVMRNIDTDEWREMEKTSLRDFRNNPLVVAFDNFLGSIGYEDMYLPAMAHLNIVWVETGRKWRITDSGEGGDSLEFDDDIEWNCFKPETESSNVAKQNLNFDKANVQVCVRGKTSCDGCEFLRVGGTCTGVVYPTYPPQFDKCQFLGNKNFSV